METEDKDNDNDGEDDGVLNEPVPLLELKRTVYVRMFNPGPQPADEKANECESFLRGESDDSVVLKRIAPVVGKILGKNKRKQKAVHFRMIFSTDAEAEEVCP